MTETSTAAMALLFNPSEPACDEADPQVYQDKRDLGYPPDDCPACKDDLAF